MRLNLFRTAESEYRLVWSFHHAILDGRSFVIVLKEVFAFYKALRDGVDLRLEKPKPYRDYIAWLDRQDLSEAETYWRTALAGIVGTTSLSLAMTRARGSQRTGHHVQ